VIDGALHQQRTVFRQIHRQASGTAIYPFSRVTRLEFTGGIEAITFDLKTTASIYAQPSGRLRSRSTSIARAAAPATLYESGVAVVHDRSMFGAVSPIRGNRYRVSVTPTFGDLAMTSVTADYRRYFMPVQPFTIAMRAMHLGRYGASAADPRLLPLMLTLRDVVRGYGDTGSNAVVGGTYGATRTVVGNLELRLPAAAAFGQGARAETFPIEGLVFFDAARFYLPGPHGLRAATLRSIGAGVRFAVAGFVFELDAARPLDRPGVGTTLAVNFLPGF
jgi:hypothetical protein